jgi:hypothetical protein
MKLHTSSFFGTLCYKNLWGELVVLFKQTVPWDFLPNAGCLIVLGEKEDRRGIKRLERRDNG